MAKRLRAEIDEDTDSTGTANLLRLLSCEPTTANNDHRATPPPRSFECKRCNRHFRSFQALGGHCTSHKRTRVELPAPFDEMPSTKPKPRVHACPVCGLKFATGQALGGHMRRHRPAVKGAPLASSGKELLMGMDLKIAPPSEKYHNLELLDLFT